VFHTFTLVLSKVCVQCPICLFFCSSSISCFPGMLSEWFWGGSSCPIYYWYHVCFNNRRAPNFCYKFCIFYNFLIFLYHISVPWNAVSMNLPVLFQVKMPGLLLGMVRSVCIFWFHNMFTSPLWLVSTDFDKCSYQCSLSNFPLISLYILNHSWAHTLPYLFMPILVCCLIKLLTGLNLLPVSSSSSWLIVVIIATYNSAGLLTFNILLREKGLRLTWLPYPGSPLISSAVDMVQRSR